MIPRTLRLALAPSPRMAGAVIGAHAASGLCAVVALPGIAGIAVGVALGALGVATAWSRALLRGPSSVTAIEFEGAHATLILRSGARIAAEVGKRRYVGRLLVTLPIRRPLASRRTLLICADMLPADLFRALRIWALWGKLPPVAREQLAA